MKLTTLLLLMTVAPLLSIGQSAPAIIDVPKRPLLSDEPNLSVMDWYARYAKFLPGDLIYATRTADRVLCISVSDSTLVIGNEARKDSLSGIATQTVYFDGKETHIEKDQQFGREITKETRDGSIRTTYFIEIAQMTNFKERARNKIEIVIEWRDGKILHLVATKDKEQWVLSSVTTMQR